MDTRQEGQRGPRSPGRRHGLEDRQGHRGLQQAVGRRQGPGSIRGGPLCQRVGGVQVHARSDRGSASGTGQEELRGPANRIHDRQGDHRRPAAVHQRAAVGYRAEHRAGRQAPGRGQDGPGLQRRDPRGREGSGMQPRPQGLPYRPGNTLDEKKRKRRTR